MERPYIEILSEHLLLARTSAAIFTIALCFFLFFGFHQCHRSICPVGEGGLYAFTPLSSRFFLFFFYFSIFHPPNHISIFPSRLHFHCAFTSSEILTTDYANHDHPRQLAHTFDSIVKTHPAFGVSRYFPYFRGFTIFPFICTVLSDDSASPLKVSSFIRLPS
jgi:hypothetical protein